ncbi:MAG: hypothetical protein CME19_24085 [Gemmatimonadetes bacterium]|nr:hypothetical protein [Gemmatimonadota bacterium]
MPRRSPLLSEDPKECGVDRQRWPRDRGWAEAGHRRTSTDLRFSEPHQGDPEHSRWRGGHGILRAIWGYSCVLSSDFGSLPNIIAAPGQSTKISIFVNWQISATSSLLRFLGFGEAITAAQWVEALDALNDQAPDLLLLDLQMRHVDGFFLLEWIPANRKSRCL